MLPSHITISRDRYVITGTFPSGRTMIMQIQYHSAENAWMDAESWAIRRPSIVFNVIRVTL